MLTYGHLTEFHEVFKNELKEPKREDDEKNVSNSRKRAEVNIDEDEYGDYLFQDEDESDSDLCPTLQRSECRHHHYRRSYPGPDTNFAQALAFMIAQSSGKLQRRLVLLARTRLPHGLAHRQSRRHPPFLKEAKGKCPQYATKGRSIQKACPRRPHCRLRLPTHLSSPLSPALLSTTRRSKEILSHTQQEAPHSTFSPIRPKCTL